jgi:aspartate/methionine/tyrosine aminotransferase
VEADRKVLVEFLDRTERVSGVRTEWGTTAFLRRAGGDTDGFLARLRAELETSAVPGRFFGAPEFFRVGMGVNHEMFAEGLRRIEEAL